LVAGTERVKVIPLHHEQIAAEKVVGNCAARAWVVLVAIRAFEKDPFPVHHHEPVPDLDLPEAHALCNHLRSESENEVV
jgi:hypothetical protein